MHKSGGFHHNFAHRDFACQMEVEDTRLRILGFCFSPDGRLSREGYHSGIVSRVSHTYFT